MDTFWKSNMWLIYYLGNTTCKRKQLSYPPDASLKCMETSGQLSSVGVLFFTRHRTCHNKRPPVPLIAQLVDMSWYIWGFPKLGAPENGWFLLGKIPSNWMIWDDLGVPLFQETSILGLENEYPTSCNC